MEHKIECPNNLEINYVLLQKMAFIYNAIENGWDIKKNNDKYIFTKQHEGKKEVFLDSYLRQFLENNANINKIFNSSN